MSDGIESGREAFRKTRRQSGRKQPLYRARRPRPITLGLAFGLWMAISFQHPARAANIRNHIEAVRRDAAVVYLGEVDTIELTERLSGRGLDATASVRVLSVARAPDGETPSEATLEYPTWDEEHPPYAGDGQYRLRSGLLVVVFAGSWDGRQIRYLLSGERAELLEDLLARRDALLAMSDDDLEFHEIDEDDRQKQAELYRELASALQ